MRTHPIFVPPTYFEVFAIVDAEFDRFEPNNDVEIQLREAEYANFYHDSFNDEE